MKQVFKQCIESCPNSLILMFNSLQAGCVGVCDFYQVVFFPVLYFFSLYILSVTVLSVVFYGFLPEIK